jgi:hypothetical protein
MPASDNERTVNSRGEVGKTGGIPRIMAEAREALSRPNVKRPRGAPAGRREPSKRLETLETAGGLEPPAC